MGERSNIRLVLIFLVCLPFCMLLMAVWHEVVGHCLTAILMGGRITLLDLFGVQIWPEFGKPGLPGRMDWVGAPGSSDFVGVAGVVDQHTVYRSEGIVGVDVKAVTMHKIGLCSLKYDE